MDRADVDPEMILKLRKNEDLAELGQNMFKDKYQKFIHYNEQNLKTIEMLEYMKNIDNKNPIKHHSEVIAEELFNIERYKTSK